MPTGTSESFALFLAGAIAPYVQRFLPVQFAGRKAELVAAGISAVLTIGAIWATGGFADIKSPAFKLQDPSAFFAFWALRYTPVLAISQTVYAKLVK